MNAAAAVFLGLAVVLAPVNWWARARDKLAVEYATKPAVTILVILAAVAVDPADDAMRWWFVAAFVGCLAGDVFLMLPQNLFIAGLASFLVAHVLFVVGFVVPGDLRRWPALLGLAVVVFGALTVGRTILAGATAETPRLGPPVTAYLAAISAMVVAAFAHGSVWGVVGAVAFYISDALLGFNRFVQALPSGPVAVMVTYHAALFGLVLSLP